MTLDQFKKSSGAKKRQQSRLFAFKSQILDLVKDGFTQQSILTFLGKNGLKTTKQNLSYFIARHIVPSEHAKENSPLLQTAQTQFAKVEAELKVEEPEPWTLPESPKGVDDLLTLCGLKK
ncbi:MAG: hypothetical protein PHE60_05760 [Sulfurospirillaceae bacterium]|nr:hypothetical protein [Sulfurospirillaceae bacterium]